MKKLVISIVTWNSAETIHACLKSVLNQTFSSFQLMIVDNDSRDATCDIIQSFQDARISLNRRSENTGFCGGHNLILSTSDSEFVLLLNPDIEMRADYVETALKTMQSNERTGTVCGLLVQSDPQDPEAIIDSAGLEMMRSGIMTMRFHGRKKTECSLTKGEVFGADGALPLYRRSMINDISVEGQFFDELFFAHKEDWDVSWRSHLYGWKTVFEPACIAVHPRHFKPKSLTLRKNISGGIKVHSVKNQLILLLKNEALSSFLINGIFIIPRQLAVFCYIVVFERTSLEAYRFVFKNYKTIMKKRREIQRRRVK